MATDSDNFENAVKDQAEEEVAEFEAHEKGVIGFVHQTLHKYPLFVPLIVMILAIIVFGLINPNFYRVNTLSVILQQVGIVGIIGIAQAIVILTAGIDLSVGAIVVFSSVIMGQFSFRYGNKKERYPAKMVQRACEAFQLLQEELADWLDPESMTKMASVFSRNSES